MFIHTVYFWLDKAMPTDLRQQMNQDCTGMLSEIPSVQNIWSGKPAGTPRDIVDNSYDIGLCVVLADKGAHDDYQVHPKHQEFGRRYKQYWKKVQVYDFVDD